MSPLKGEQWQAVLGPWPRGWRKEGKQKRALGTKSGE